MYKKLNDLRFVIGLFFSVISLILLVSSLLGNGLPAKLNIYSGLVLLVFGLAMMFINGKANNNRS